MCQPVRDVSLHYLPWGNEGLWCPRITLSFDARRVELLLAEGRQNDVIGPVSDNVAVLFNPVKLPVWGMGL